MTVEECYNSFGGNYRDVLSRLMKEERVEKYLKLFPSEDVITPLEKSLNDKDYKNAFMQAHSLKGMCATLGISRLFKSSSDLTESIRNGEVKEDPIPLFNKVKEDYTETVNAIKKLD